MCVTSTYLTFCFSSYHWNLPDDYTLNPKLKTLNKKQIKKTYLKQINLTLNIKFIDQIDYIPINQIKHFDMSTDSMVFENSVCNPRTCYSTHKILLQSFSFLHYITTYSAYFNSPNNSARNLFLLEEKSREKPGRWFSTNFNSTPYWTMLRSQYSIETGSSKWFHFYWIVML